MPHDPLSPVSTDGEGRRPDGRFGAANTFAKGNPNFRKMHALRKALLSSVDDGAMKEVGEKLTSLARGGDLDAIKILLAYTIGKPPAAIALTGPDGEALGMDWSAVQGTIMNALASFPEARLAVAIKLKGIAVNDTSDGERSGDDS
jgi:hypothetical protein